MSTQTLTSTTQVFLDIHDITSNLVIMKDGTTSIILTVDAMNFGLLAEEEQDGIIYAYAGLLNSLNYPIQIVIRSQTKDVTQYLTLLKDQEERTTSPVIQNRIRTYREFVSNLIHERNVLDKKFYVVIPVTGMELGIVSPQTFLPGAKPVDLSTVERTVIIEKARSILEPKRDHLIAQFARIGLFARELETQEIIQLFYLSYNPEAAEGQEITDSQSYTTPLVKAAMQTTVQDMLAQASPVAPHPQEMPAATTNLQPAPEPLQQTQVDSQVPVAPIAPSVETTDSPVEPEFTIPALSSTPPLPQQVESSVQPSVVNTPSHNSVPEMAPTVAPETTQAPPDSQLTQTTLPPLPEIT